MLTKRELMEVLEARGAGDISSKQLWDWGQNGLIPSGVVRPVREGRGRTTYYPDGTPRRAIAVRNALQERRSFDYALLKLWLDGEDVPGKSLFEGVLEELEEFVSALERYEWSDRPEDWDEYERWLNDIVETPETPSILGRIRRRVSKEHFPVIVELTRHVYVAPSNEPMPGDKELAYRISIVDKALSLFIPDGVKMPWQVDRLEKASGGLHTGGGLDEGAFYEAIAKIRECLSLNKIANILADSTGGELRQAYWEAVTLYGILASSLFLLDEGRGVKNIETLPFIPSWPVGSQVLITLGWLAIKNAVELKDEVKELETSLEPHAKKIAEMVVSH